MPSFFNPADPSTFSSVSPSTMGGFVTATQKGILGGKSNAAGKGSILRELVPPYAREYVERVGHYDDILSDGFCRIGDSAFEIPPEKITVSRTSMAQKVRALRGAGSIHIQAGHSDVIIDIEMYFDGAEEIFGVDPFKNGDDIDRYRTINPNSLAALIAQFRKAPFLPVFNSSLNNVHDVQALALVNLQLTTLPQQPNLVKVNLTCLKYDHLIHAPALLMGMECGFVWPVFRWYWRKFHEFNPCMISPNFVNGGMNGGLDFFIADKEGLQKYKKAVEDYTKKVLDAAGRAKNWTPFSWFTEFMGDSKVEHPEDHTKAVDPARLSIPLKKVELGDDLVLTSVVVTLENAISSVNIDGRENPAYQFLGSGDARINLVFLTGDENAVAKLVQLAKTSEEIARDFRTYISGGFLGVENELINLAGIENVLIEGIRTARVEGQPEIHEVVLTLVSFNRMQRVYETLKAQRVYEEDGKLSTDSVPIVRNYKFSTRLDEAVKKALDTKLEKRGARSWFKDFWKNKKLVTKALAPGIVGMDTNPYFQAAYIQMALEFNSQLDLYPDLGLPTVEELYDALKDKEISKDKDLIKDLTEYYQAIDAVWWQGGRFVDPDFYMSYPICKFSDKDYTQGAFDKKMTSGENVLTQIYGWTAENLDKLMVPVMSMAAFKTETILKEHWKSRNVALLFQIYDEYRKYFAPGSDLSKADFIHMGQMLEGQGVLDYHLTSPEGIQELYDLLADTYKESALRNPGAKLDMWKAYQKALVSEKPEDAEAFESDYGFKPHLLRAGVPYEIAYINDTTGQIITGSSYYKTSDGDWSPYRTTEKYKEYKQLRKSDLLSKHAAVINATGEQDSDIRLLLAIAAHYRKDGVSNASFDKYMLQIRGAAEKGIDDLVKVLGDDVTTVNVTQSQSVGLQGEVSTFTEQVLVDGYTGQSLLFAWLALDEGVLERLNAQRSKRMETVLKESARLKEDIGNGTIRAYEVAIDAIDEILESKDSIDNYSEDAINEVRSQVINILRANGADKNIGAYSAERSVGDKIYYGAFSITKNMLREDGSLNTQVDSSLKIAIPSNTWGGWTSEEMKIRFAPETLSRDSIMESAKVVVGMALSYHSSGLAVSEEIGVGSEAIYDDTGTREAVDGLEEGSGLTGSPTEKSKAGAEQEDTHKINDFYALFTPYDPYAFYFKQAAADRKHAATYGSYIDMLIHDKSGRIIQAYPTYLLQLVDEGPELSWIRFFPCFYALSSVSDIAVIADRENVADVCMLTLTNAYNNIGSQTAEQAAANLAYDMPWAQWWKALLPIDQIWFIPGGGGDAVEHIIKHRQKIPIKIMLRPGVRIHLRMGFGGNGSALPVVFNGTITELNHSDVSTVIAQGDGVEWDKELSFNEDPEKNLGGLLVGMEPRDLILTMINCRTEYDLVRTGLWDSTTAKVSQWLYAGTNGKLLHDSPFRVSHFGKPFLWHMAFTLLDKSPLIDKLREGTLNEADTSAIQKTLEMSSLKGQKPWWVVLTEGTAAVAAWATGWGIPYTLAVTLLNDYKYGIPYQTQAGETGENVYIASAYAALKAKENQGKEIKLSESKSIDYHEGFDEFKPDAANPGGLKFSLLGTNGFRNLITHFTYGINMYVEGKKLWDIVELSAAAFPPYVAAVRPFEFRSTLFYGAPYYAYREGYYRIGSQHIVRGLVGGHSLDGKSRTGEAITVPISPSLLGIPFAYKHKTFCQMHYVSSDMNLISNGIKASSEEMYTDVAMTWYTHTSDSGRKNERHPIVYVQHVDRHIYPEIRKSLVVDSAFLGPGLPIVNFVREWNIPLFNGIIETLIPPILHKLYSDYGFFGAYAAGDRARSIARSILRDSVRKMYQGELVTLPMPSLRPYDALWLQDSVVNMWGPLLVRRVVQHFSHETGFVTSTTPDLMAEVKGDSVWLSWLVYWGVHAVSALSIAKFANYAVKSMVEARALVAKGITEGAKRGMWVRVAEIESRVANLKAGAEYKGIMTWCKETLGKGTGWVEKTVQAEATKEIAKDAGLLSRITRKVAGGATTGARVAGTAAKATVAVDTALMLGVKNTVGRSVLTRTAMAALGLAPFTGGTSFILWLAAQVIFELITHTIGTWLWRQADDADSLVLAPLRYMGGEYTAGISGHKKRIVIPVGSVEANSDGKEYDLLFRTDSGAESRKSLSASKDSHYHTLVRSDFVSSKTMANHIKTSEAIGPSLGADFEKRINDPAFKAAKAPLDSVIENSEEGSVSAEAKVGTDKAIVAAEATVENRTAIDELLAFQEKLGFDELLNHAAFRPLTAGIMKRASDKVKEIFGLTVDQAVSGERVSEGVTAYDQLFDDNVTLPVDKAYKASSGFGNRFHPIKRKWLHHDGVDFLTPLGTPVRAIYTGKVTYAERMGGYGLVVFIDHGKNKDGKVVETRYAHLSKIDVSVGDTVKRGKIIGKSGSTGLSTGPHFHFEVRVDGVPVNPDPILRGGGGKDVGKISVPDVKTTKNHIQVDYTNLKVKANINGKVYEYDLQRYGKNDANNSGSYGYVANGTYHLSGWKSDRHALINNAYSNGYVQINMPSGSGRSGILFHDLTEDSLVGGRPYEEVHPFSAGCPTLSRPDFASFLQRLKNSGVPAESFSVTFTGEARKWYKNQAEYEKHIDMDKRTERKIK